MTSSPTTAHGPPALPDSDAGPSPVRGHVRRVGWQRLSYGLYVPSPPVGRRPTPGSAARAGNTPDDVRVPAEGGPPAPYRWADLQAWSLTLPPGAGFTSLTAAHLAGWWLPRLPRQVPVFAGAANAGTRPRRPGLVLHRHTHVWELGTADGLPVLPGIDVLLSAARDLAVLDVIVLLDSALRAGAVEPDQIRCALARRRYGARRLHQALQYADPAAESAWETLLRVLLQTSGIPVRTQHEVRADGRFVARGDLWIEGTRTLQEYDGGVHPTPDQHAADLARDAALQRINWVRYGYTHRTVLRQGVLVLRDAERALGWPHNSARLRRWHRLLTDSSYTSTGLDRLAARWAPRM